MRAKAAPTQNKLIVHVITRISVINSWPLPSFSEDDHCSKTGCYPIKYFEEPVSSW